MTRHWRKVCLLYSEMKRSPLRSSWLPLAISMEKSEDKVSLLKWYLATSAVKNVVFIVCFIYSTVPLWVSDSCCSLVWFVDQGYSCGRWLLSEATLWIVFGFSGLWIVVWAYFFVVDSISALFLNYVCLPASCFSFKCLCDELLYIRLVNNMIRKCVKLSSLIIFHCHPHMYNRHCLHKVILYLLYSFFKLWLMYLWENRAHWPN